MKITFTIESNEGRENFHTPDFDREACLERMGLPEIVTNKLKKDLDSIRITAKEGGLRINRELYGISREELSEKTGIPVSMLQQYEEGGEDINNASLRILLKICRALECTLSEILTDQETIDAWEEYLDYED